MPKRSCECINLGNSYNLCDAICKSCMSPWFPAVTITWILLNRVNFVIAKKDLFSCYIKQIINVFCSCSGPNISFCWKMKYSIQLSFASLNGTLHLSIHVLLLFVYCTLMAKWKCGLLLCPEASVNDNYTNYRTWYIFVLF